MAKYFFDPADYAPGDLATQGWQKRLRPERNWEKQAGSGGAPDVFVCYGDQQFVGAPWALIETTASHITGGVVQGATKCFINTATTPEITAGLIFLDLANSPENDSGLAVCVIEDELVVRHVPSATVLASAPVDFTANANVQFYVRAEYDSGSQLLHGTAWIGEPEDEPEGWQIEDLDVSEYVIEAVGLFALRRTPTFSYLFLGIGTEGDPAPLEPVSEGPVELTVASASHAHAAESPSLIQAHALAVADAVHDHAAESPVLTQAHALAVAEASHAQTADSPTLTQAQELAVADAFHDHAAESPALTQTHQLAVADTGHGHTAEAPAITTGTPLEPADATHAQTADSPVLVQANVLAPDEATHAHTADSPALSSSGTLAPADATHGHAAESPLLIQAHIVAVQAALHQQTADSPALSTAFSLLVAEAIHQHTADAPQLIPEFTLAVAEALHQTTAAVVTLEISELGEPAAILSIGTRSTTARAHGRAIAGKVGRRMITA